MNIAIDANEANIIKRVGIGRYAFNVLWGIYNIAKKSREKVKFVVLTKSQPVADMPISHSFWQYKVLNPGFLWTQIALRRYLKVINEKPDLLFTTSHYAPYLTDIKTIISIMDLSYIHYPKLFNRIDLIKLKYLTALSVKKARKIITISKFSKSEIVNFYGINPDKITVAYPGVETDIFKPAKTENNSSYILFVGTLQPRKNIAGLIKAFKLISSDHNLKLVIAGKKGWLYENIFSEVRKYGLQDRIIFKDYVNEYDLIKLYQKAVCFVLPSFYEGFGIPVIEAMACGCPVIVSNSSSLAEIVGNAGLRINPYKHEEIAKAIIKVISDKDTREKLKVEGIRQAKNFSWQKTSQIIYTNLISEALNK